MLISDGFMVVEKGRSWACSNVLINADPCPVAPVAVHVNSVGETWCISWVVVDGL